MNSYYSDVVQFRGSHYDFGRYQGEKLKDSPILKNRQKQWKPRMHRHFITDESLSIDILKKIAPQIVEEIYGLRDALGLDTKTALQQFGGYYLELVVSGCSIFADEDFLIRNYDSHPRGYEGRYVFYQPTDQGFSTVGPSMQIAGRIDGINEKGLTIGYNFTHTKKSSDGFLCSMISRLVLETCETVDDAIDLLKEIPHRHSFSYVVQDQAGIPYVIEASPRKVIHRQSNVCTNHFHVLNEENRYRQEETREREQNIINYQNCQPKPYDAFMIMNQMKHGIASHKYDASAGTLHTSMYFPKTLTSLFSLGTDRKPVVFDFKKWLSGENVNVSKLKGQINSDKLFVNMK